LAFKRFRIQGASGTGIGIELNATTTPIASPVFEDLVITGMGSHGIHCDLVNFPLFINVTSLINEGDGFRFTGNCAQVRMVHTYALQNDDQGINCNNVLGFQLDGVGVEDNQQDQTAKSDDANPQMMLESTSDVSIQRVDFESFAQATTKTALAMNNCRGVQIAGNTFVNLSVGGRGIFVDENDDGICIMANSFGEVATAIEVNGGATDVSQNVFIGPNGYANAVTTALTLPTVAQRESKNIVVMDTAGSHSGSTLTHVRGLLLPVYTTAKLPTASGCEGAIAYDSTTQTMKWSNGTSWATI
jgi:hypothetical protein